MAEEGNDGQARQPKSATSTLSNNSFENDSKIEESKSWNWRDLCLSCDKT